MKSKEGKAVPGISEVSGETDDDPNNKKVTMSAAEVIDADPENGEPLIKKEKGISPESCQKIGKKVMTEDDKDSPLKRSVGLLSGIGIIIGCIIGSGIFITPAGVHKGAGSVGLSLIIWLAAGIFVLLGSFCYIELGLLLRESGGDYAYIHYAFGGFASFIRLWIEAVVVRPGSEAIVALTFATYVVYPFGLTMENGNKIYIILIAILMIAVQTALNCISIKTSLIINNICTVAKVIALIGIIGVGVYSLSARDEGTKNFNEPFANTSSNPGAIALAFYSALYAYQGWNYLNFIIEEVRNPVKTLPRAIIVSSIFVIFIYVAVNVAFYTGVSAEKFLEPDPTAIKFAENIFGWKGSDYIISLFVVVASFGSGNGLLFTSSRLFFVGARNDHMPKCLLMTHPKFKTPIPAIVLTALISLCFLALSDNAIYIIDCIAVSYWLAIGVSIAALIYYRFKIPKEEYPFLVWLPIAIVFLIGCIALVILPFCQEWKESQKAVIGLAIMATGIPVYLIFIRFRINCLDCTADILTKLIHVLFRVVFEEDEVKPGPTQSETSQTPLPSS